MMGFLSEVGKRTPAEEEARARKIQQRRQAAYEPRRRYAPRYYDYPTVNYRSDPTYQKINWAYERFEDQVPREREYTCAGFCDGGACGH